MTKLREIYDTERDLSLAGGKNGLDNIIELTHMAENMEICRDFVRENELVFTTGSGLKDDSQLLNFVKTAYKNRACGVVINFGPYFPSISDKITEFADLNAFPVFTCTWEVRMPDIMYRISCLIEGEKTTVGRKSIAFKTAALHPERVDILKSEGYSKRSKIRIVATKDGCVFSGSDASFTADSFTFNVFVNKTKTEIINSVDNKNAYVSPECDINSYAHGFILTQRFARLFESKNGLSFVEDGGIYYLLLNLNDPAVLKSYADSVLGRIEKLDKNNKNSLTLTLKTYLDNKKSPTVASEILSVHKNTVINKIKKIENALNIDFSDANDELNIKCAFIARDIYKII